MSPWQFHYTRTVFPCFAFAIISLSAWCILCFVCHYFWHFSCIAFICQMQVVTSFRAPLQFHCLCHFRLCYLSSLSTLDSFLNKSIVIYLCCVNKSSCLQPWFYSSGVGFWTNEALSESSSRKTPPPLATYSSNWVVLPSHPITALPYISTVSVMAMWPKGRHLLSYCVHRSVDPGDGPNAKSLSESSLFSC